MKNRFLFLFVASLAMSFTGCRHLEGEGGSSAEPVLNQIILSVTTNSDFVTGKTFEECATPVVKGKYSDGSFAMFNSFEVEYTLLHGSAPCDYNSPFTEVGTYSLKAEYYGFHSNTYTFTVQEASMYADSITVRGAKSVGLYDTITLTIVTNPVDYSGEVTFTNLNLVVGVTKVNNRTFTVKGNVAGSATITFKAQSSSTEYITAVHKVTVQNIAKTTIQQTFNDKPSYDHQHLDSYLTQSVGDAHILVIPIWFQDSSTYILPEKKSLVLSDIKSVFNGKLTDVDYCPVSTYYQVMSGGKFNVSFYVSDWYYPGYSFPLIRTAAKFNELLKGSVDYYFTNVFTARSYFDMDNNNRLDGVVFVPAIPSDSNIYRYIDVLDGEPFANWYHDDEHSIKFSGFCWMGYDFMYNSTRATARTGKSHHRQNIKVDTVCTNSYIRIFAKLLGGRFLNNASPNHSAGFNMLDDGYGVVDPFHAMAFGWTNPYIPTSSCSITINEYQSTRDLIVLTPSWNSFGSPFDEYFVLELFTSKGFNYHYANLSNTCVGSVGIRLWHINATLKNNTYYTQDVTSPYLPELAYSNGEYNSNSLESSYSLAHVIRNDTSKNYVTTSKLSSVDLFDVYDYFTFNAYYKQLAKGYKNGTICYGDNKTSGWEFSVSSKTNGLDGPASITVSLTKLS